MSDDQVLAGRYELGRRLGLGGMAEVFLGKDRVLGRTVAVKTLLPQFAQDPSFIARFRREATSAAALNHPHIVGVYDTGSDDGRHYIVMEYVEGKTLRDVIREEGPLLPERAAEVAADVCSALQFAHAHGIVHRDTKPANIMINPRGEVKVADFGIARAASGESVTQTATVLGTAQYFSPEQAQAGPVDARSDLYSLGVVLYEMLTRTVPFTGSSPVAIAYKHVKEDPVPPSRLNPDVPPALEAVVMKALAKNPDNRYQSAQDMRQDIERAIRGLPVSAPRVMPADHTSVMSTTGGVGDETVMLRRPGGPRRAQPDRSRRGLGAFLLALILFGMIALIVWALVSSLPKSHTVTVPNVVGKDQATAQQMLRAAKLDVIVNTATPDPTASPGIIILQDPAANTKVEQGKQVAITPSAGKPQVQVPSVVGMQFEAARQKLQDVGLLIGQKKEAFSDKPVGEVLSQNPGAGGFVGKNSTVDVTVSKGPDQAIVPNLIGLTNAQAEAALQQRGLVGDPAEELQNPNCDRPDGQVCRQTPAAGTKMNKGGTVHYVVAREPQIIPSQTQT